MSKKAEELYAKICRAFFNDPNYKPFENYPALPIIAEYLREAYSEGYKRRDREDVRKQGGISLPEK